MRKLTLLLWLFLAGIAFAADTQWLQCHTSQDPSKSGISYNGLSWIDMEPLDGVPLPKDPGSDVHAGKWYTPMAKDGFLWLAVGRSAGNSVYDLLFVDSNCDGSLADELPHRPRTAGERQTDFGPIKVLFQTADGPVAYHINVGCIVCYVSAHLSVSPACWYEGTVDIAGKEYKCVLVDWNANGTFNDTSMNLDACDQIKLGQDEKPASRSLGRYIQVDGKLFCPRVSRDGSSVTFEPAGSVPMGTAVVSGEVRSLRVAGENGDLQFDIENGKARLPAGRWIISEYAIARKDSTGLEWRLHGSVFPLSTVFQVQEGKEAVLDVGGEPVRVSIRATKRGTDYQFAEMLRGRLGEVINISREGYGGAPAPVLRIRNADRSYDKTLMFEYG